CHGRRWLPLLYRTDAIDRQRDDPRHCARGHVVTGEARTAASPRTCPRWYRAGTNLGHKKREAHWQTVDRQADRGSHSSRARQRDGHLADRADLRRRHRHGAAYQAGTVSIGFVKIGFDKVDQGPFGSIREGTPTPLPALEISGTPSKTAADF